MSESEKDGRNSMLKDLVLDAIRNLEQLAKREQDFNASELVNDSGFRNSTRGKMKADLLYVQEAVKKIDEALHAGLVI